jgi:hypothetical protein
LTAAERRVLALKPRTTPITQRRCVAGACSPFAEKLLNWRPIVAKANPRITDFFPKTFHLNVVYNLQIIGTELPQDVSVLVAETGNPTKLQWFPPSQNGQSDAASATSNDGELIQVPVSVASLIGQPPVYGHGELTVTVTNNTPNGDPFTASVIKPTKYEP